MDTQAELEAQRLAAINLMEDANLAKANLEKLNKELKEALQKSQNLALIVGSSDDAILSKDLEGNIISWNKGAEHLYGYSESEAIGQNINFIVPEDIQDEIPRILNRVKRGRSLDHYETTRKTKAGKFIDISLTVSPLRNEAGEIIGASAIARDISDKKEKEEIKRLATELERSNQDLAQFAYIASHDLQEPLRTVESFLALFLKQIDKRGLEDKKLKKYSFYITDATARMRNLIEDILAYSRVGKKREFKPIDLNKVLEQITLNLHSKIKEKKAKIHYQALPELNVNETEINQLFLNLIGNALKFTQKDLAPEIKINAQEQKNGTWLFSIEDNGIGITQDYKDKVFELFQRLHGDDEYSGTGIGLSLCKKIVENHGGSIWFESELGKGTIFYFTIFSQA